MSCGVGRRCSLDPALLWLWRRLVATAPIQPLPWEPPYAARAAKEMAKRQKKKKKILISCVLLWLQTDSLPVLSAYLYALAHSVLGLVFILFL